MSNIFILSAKAGAGKTTVVIDVAIKQAMVAPVVIMQETIGLIDQTLIDIQKKNTSNVQIEKITSNEGNVAQTIYDSVKDKTPRIMLITQAGFKLAMNKGADFSEFIGYWDEFMEVVDVSLVKTELSSTVFDLSHTVLDTEGTHSVITASDQLREWFRKGKPKDWGFDGFDKSGIPEMLLASYRKNFLSKDGRYFTSVITPAIFSAFKELTLIGAFWEQHEQSMFWKECTQVSPLQCLLRNVDINSNVFLGYLTSAQWSQKFIKENSDKIADILNDVFEEHEDYLFASNNDVQFLNLREYTNSKYYGVTSGASHVKTKCAGLNTYKIANAAAFMCCLTRPDWYYAEVQEIFKMSTLEIMRLEITCHNAYFAYQFLYRTRIRLYNSEDVDFVVGSKLVAEAVQEMFNGVACMQCVDTEQVLVETTNLHAATAAGRVINQAVKKSMGQEKEIFKEKKKEVNAYIRRATQNKCGIMQLDVWKAQRDIAILAGDLGAIGNLLRDIADIFQEKGWSFP
ncbi:hypothetical protein V0242_18575 [Aeromonas hydrophila]|uniref:hypothetical protein n=1 Tax=Aeromonas hydrophila TaxID=644 RepID=UPI002ED4B5A8|nr:hypothetical protein V0242_18575 [Aeromonas hydrophila]